MAPKFGATMKKPAAGKAQKKPAAVAAQKKPAAVAAQKKPAAVMAQETPAAKTGAAQKKPAAVMAAQKKPAGASETAGQKRANGLPAAHFDDLLNYWSSDDQLDAQPREIQQHIDNMAFCRRLKDEWISTKYHRAAPGNSSPCPGWSLAAAAPQRPELLQPSVQMGQLAHPAVPVPPAVPAQPSVPVHLSVPAQPAEAAEPAEPAQAAQPQAAAVDAAPDGASGV